jgi:hypothetical protein
MTSLIGCSDTDQHVIMFHGNRTPHSPGRLSTVLAAIVLMAQAAIAEAASETRSIPNPLHQDWPWELVSIDCPPGTVAPGWVATIAGIDGPRPIQIERVQVDGKPTDRCWFIATVAASRDAATVTVAPGTAASPLSVHRDGGMTVVETGVAELRLRLEGVAPGTPLARVPHWMAGIRVDGQTAWDGRAWFEGTSPVSALTVEQVANGPVFAEWHLSYAFADAAVTGVVDAVPLMLGKQSFRFQPNSVPSERISKRERHYEVAIRAVMGDPWIEVVERYRLPRDPAGGGFGIHQYTLAFGATTATSGAVPGFAPGGMPLDTVLWTRWFEYDVFGGNNQQLAMPAVPRPVQRGRPFAQLRARWSQSPGGAQDCLFTSGGMKADAGADQAPAIGVIAAYPSKWVGPYDATIVVQAQDGNRGSFRFPLTDGGTDQGTGEPLWYGGRCWALVAAPRRLVQGGVDALIRRHSDWTLTALINRYRLSWPGMGAGTAGPNPSQYLDRRYQCDDVNPTNYGNRRLVNDLFEKSLDRRRDYGPLAAATAYISTDLDAWPGWHNGWGPGNPNFHTDKYLASIYAAVGLREHPHAPEWLAFGRSCLTDDLAKVVTAPDGVGSECPGYAGYSLGLQAKVARTLLDAGLGNAFAEDPLVAKSLTWHRKLLTPFDRRLGLRHEAPIGDTHRWTSGAKFADFLPFYLTADPPFAAELRLADALIHASGPGPAGAQGLDWSSQAFAGFGAVLRDRFGSDQESFLSFKSGPVSGHYHNDDQSFHWYQRGTPIALNYNCSYHPRGDHAALHNTITLGNAGQVRHNARAVDVPALEQPFGPAAVRRFATSTVADVVVADRRINSLVMSPVEPHDAEFNREYPGRPVDADHRRLLLLSKHGPASPFSDYLVVRDEIRTSEAQQVNLHLLARDARIDGDRVLLTGQWDQDILVQVVEATNAVIESRRWAYADENMAPPMEFLPKPGESPAAWDARLPVQRPMDGWKPTYLKDDTAANLKRWDDLIAATDGAALMPPPGWTSTWTYGECQRWLRVSSTPGTPVTMVIYPYPRGQTPPQISRDHDAIIITAGGTTERVILGTAAGAALGGTVLLGPGLAKP